MSFYRRIKYFLVHTLKLTNEDAQATIDKGVIELDGVAIKDNVFLNDFTEIKIDGKVGQSVIQALKAQFPIALPPSPANTQPQKIPIKYKIHLKQTTPLLLTIIRIKTP